MFNLQNFNSINRTLLKTFLLGCAAFCAFFFSANAAQAATYTVTNVNDAGLGSLRQAITDVNTAFAADATINFSFPAGGVRTVNLLSPLPTIYHSVTIDGTTMAGYNGAPLFELNGAGAGANANGLTFRQGQLAVKALIINRFSGDGIVAVCRHLPCQPNFDDVGLSVTGSYIGTDKTGNAAAPKAATGFYTSLSSISARPSAMTR